MMKKILITIITCVLMLTITVNAEEQKDKVNVYFFHGDGCPHCEDATKFFDSIDDDFKEYYNLIKYEVWNSEENSALMEQVRRRLNDDLNGGVPYIVIGKDSFSGFDDNVGKQIKETIEKEYKKSKRYDVMTAKDDQTAAIITIAGIIIVIAGIVYLRFKNNQE